MRRSICYLKLVLLNMKTFIYSTIFFLLIFSPVFSNNLQVKMENIKASLIIPNEDDIRGNITLLPEKDGASIVWNSSHSKSDLR